MTAEDAPYRTVALAVAAAADLSGAALHTSFEPCPMGCGAILVSGLTRVVTDQT
jgi:tRNA(Arg) A34 adenosine deaminase TadA